MFSMKNRFIVLGALAATMTLAACDPGEESTTERSGDTEVVQLEGWQADVEAERARIEQERPEFYAQIMAVEPVMARNHMPRLRVPEIADPDAAPILLHRIMQGEGEPETRAALAEALQVTRGNYGPAAVGLLASEETTEVRIGLAIAIQRADHASALAGIELALEDEDSRVRAMAALSAARLVNTEKLADDHELTAKLIKVLDDSDWDVRRQSAWSLGLHESKAAQAKLTQLLDDEHAMVRLTALRSLDRIDAQYVQSLPQLDVLAEDDDAKVSRLANKIAARNLAAPVTP